MRIVVQRVANARVSVQGRVVGEIGPGLVALVGVGHDDDQAVARRLADKLVAARLFADGERPFHRTVADVAGAVLVVSQFTLLADMRRGNRPSWAGAARPEQAQPLVEAVARRVGECGVPVERGRFGAEMLLVLENDGPVTLVLDSHELARPRGG